MYSNKDYMIVCCLGKSLTVTITIMRSNNVSIEINNDDSNNNNK